MGLVPRAISASVMKEIQLYGIDYGRIISVVGCVRPNETCFGKGPQWGIVLALPLLA